MRYLLTFALLGVVISGCGRSRPTPQASATDSRDIANIAPEGRSIDEGTPNGSETHLPVMTANSPPIILTPIQGDAATPSAPNALPTDNWKTFTSTALGVTLDYPQDWSVAEEADQVTFTSPKGGTIQMKAGTAVRSNNEFKIGNQVCTSRTNDHNLTADVCVDHASFIYTAKFSLSKTDGSTQWITLLTQNQSVGEVLDAMFNSARPTS